MKRALSLTFLIPLLSAAWGVSRSIDRREDNENRTIDYNQQDFTQDGSQYDIILDAVGKRSFSECKSALTPQGIYITTLPNADVVIQGVLTAFVLGKKARFVFQTPSGRDLTYLKDLIEAGKIRSEIERTYLLEEIVAAHQYSETGRAAGKIAIAIAENNSVRE